VELLIATRCGLAPDEFGDLRRPPARSPDGSSQAGQLDAGRGDRRRSTSRLAGCERSRRVASAEMRPTCARRPRQSRPWRPGSAILLAQHQASAHRSTCREACRTGLVRDICDGRRAAHRPAGRRRSSAPRCSPPAS